MTTITQKVPHSCNFIYHLEDKVLLEDVQKFALGMGTKQWDSGYQELLDIMNVPSLTDRRLQLKLALLYKIVYGMCYFPSDILCPRTYTTRSDIDWQLGHLLPSQSTLIT